MVDMLLARMWYFFFFGGMVCVWPYLNLLYRANGLDDAQIGVLAAIKPWVSAPASFLWSGLADRYSCHKPLLLATFVVSTLTRTSTVSAHSFVAFMLLAAAGEFVAAPVGVMADAAVVAACKQDTDYGKSRLWGAVAWGGLSTFSGWMVSKFGMPSGFAAYLVLSIPCVFCAWKMEFKLGSHHRQQQQEQQHQGAQHKQQAGQKQRPSLLVAAPGAAADDTQFQVPDQQRQQQPKKKQSSQLGCDTLNVDLEQQPLMQQQHHHHQKQQDVDDSSSLSAQGQELAERQQQQQTVNLGNMTTAADTSLGVEQQQPLQLTVMSAGSSSSSATSKAGPEHHQQRQQQQEQQQHHVALPVSTPPAVGLPPKERAQQPATATQTAATTPAAAPPPDRFWRSLLLLLRRPEVLIFMGQATAMGFGIGVIGEFLFLFLQELGGSETLMGLTLTMTCVAEVPVFHYQGRVLQVISVHTMLHIVLLTYTLRLGLYALLPYTHTPWAVLPIELLHGITFACGWGAGTINSKRVAPPELAATMQGIFQGLYFGVGQGLGALIGGVLKERFGGQAMFALCAGLILAAWLLVVAAECATGSSSSSSTAVVEASASMSVQHTSEKQVDGYPVSSQQQRARAREEQQRQAQLQEAESLPHQQPSGLWLLPQRWWQRARQGLGGGGVHGSNRSRQWKYLELGSKDSGPDLGAMMMMQQQQQ